MTLQFTMFRYARSRVPDLSFLSMIFLKVFGKSLRMDHFRHSQLQQLPLQLLSVMIGVIAVSTILVITVFWGYILRKLKRSRQTSSAYQCVDLKQGGRGPAKSGEVVAYASGENMEVVGQQPSSMGTGSKYALRGARVTDSEDCFLQIIAEAQKATAPSKSSESAAIDSTSMPISFDYTSPRFPRKAPSYGQHELDLEFLEFERQVQTRAQRFQDISSDPDNRQAWESLKFWKRDSKMRGIRTCVSAAPTPLHPSFMDSTYKPSTLGYSPNCTKQRSSGPVYTDDFSTLQPQYWSNRPLTGLAKGGKMTMPRGDDCNMSPYVPLKRTHRIPSAPLYLV